MHCLHSYYRHSRHNFGDGIAVELCLDICVGSSEQSEGETDGLVHMKRE